MLFGALIFAATAVDLQAGREDAAYYLDGPGFNCLIQNIDAISRHRGRNLTIDLRRCPPRPQVSERLHSWPAFRYPRTTGEGSSVDTVIVLSSEEVACIRANRRRPERLRQASGVNRYRLTVPRCGR